MDVPLQVFIFVFPHFVEFVEPIKFVLLLFELFLVLGEGGLGFIEFGLEFDDVLRHTKNLTLQMLVLLHQLLPLHAFDLALLD